MKWLYLLIGVIGLMPGFILLLPYIDIILRKSPSNVIGGTDGPTFIYLTVAKMKISLVPSWTGFAILVIGIVIYTIGLVIVLNKTIPTFSNSLRNENLKNGDKQSAITISDSEDKNEKENQDNKMEEESPKKDIVEWRKDGVYLQDGTRIFETPPDSDLVAGELNKSEKLLLASISSYESENLIVIIDIQSHKVVKKLIMPCRISLDGSEGPTWCFEGSGVIIAILGDPSDTSAMSDVQSFLLWNIKDNTLTQINGRGRMFHTPFQIIDEKILRYSPKSKDFKEIPIESNGKTFEIKIEAQ